MNFDEENLRVEAWFTCLQSATKRCVAANRGIRRVYYKFQDGREMIEDWREAMGSDQAEVVGRYWKRKSVLGNRILWDAEVGDEMQSLVMDGAQVEEQLDPKYLSTARSNVQPLMRENSSNPTVSCGRNGPFYEWRIRNLPPPGDNYKVCFEEESGSVVISSKNHKYYKKLKIMDVERFQLDIKPHMVASNFSHRTLIIRCEKPKQVMELDKRIWTDIVRKLRAETRAGNTDGIMEDSTTPNCAQT